MERLELYTDFRPTVLLSNALEHTSIQTCRCLLLEIVSTCAVCYMADIAMLLLVTICRPVEQRACMYIADVDRVD